MLPEFDSIQLLLFDNQRNNFLADRTWKTRRGHRRFLLFVGTLIFHLDIRQNGLFSKLVCLLLGLLIGGCR